MRVSIHQPQYLPWLPYMQKIQECDLFIYLDSVDFQKNGLQNRNKIKTPNGDQWLTVPVKHHLGQKIVDTEIMNSNKWRKKHWQTIRQNYSKASAFDLYQSELEHIFLTEWERLSELNIELTGKMLKWMEIDTDIRKSSQMEVTGASSDLVLNLCLEVGATHYLTGTGGLNYLQLDDFKKAGITVDVQSIKLPEAYPQQYPKAGFFNDLSALDMILNCGDQWHRYL